MGRHCAHTIAAAHIGHTARLGGLALWAFGGMALVDTPVQRRMKIKDSPEIAYRDVASIPPDAEPFDLAMMFGVMVYLDEDRLLATLRGIHRCLRPGGALIITDPDGAKLAARSISASTGSPRCPSAMSRKSAGG